MAEKRQHQRIKCAAKCLLHYSDATYNGAITNISISGALVELSSPAPRVILPGDTCDFTISSDPASISYRYSGRIARVMSTGIGLEILEHEFNRM